MTTGADLAAGGRLATTIIAGLFVAAACTSATTPAPATSTPSTPSPPTSPASSAPATVAPAPTPNPSRVAPTATPAPAIEHATGQTDDLLRFEDGTGESEFGGVFAPGPIFTLYGDGTVIFRNDLAKPPPTEGSIVRALPFWVAHLSEPEIQSVLRFALDQGGLGSARKPPADSAEAVYGEELGDDYTSALTFRIHLEGLDNRVLVLARDPTLALGPDDDPDAQARSAFATLADYFRHFGERANVPTTTWMPDRYWGTLAGPWSNCDTAIKWPWPEIGLDGFLLPEQLHLWEWYWPGSSSDKRRIMTSEEAALLGLQNIAGGVQTCLVGPNNGERLFFALWPLSPADTGDRR